MKAMSFRQWLKENHAEAKDNRLGNLWGDAKDDIHYPWKASYRKQLEYLMRRTHEYAVYDTLNSAWHSYIDYLPAVATGEED
jgi:hypothetical protein